MIETDMLKSNAKNRDRIKTVSALVVGAIAISFSAIFFRLAAPTHPVLAPGVRLLMAGAILSPWIVFQVARKRVPMIWVITGLLGGVLYALHFALWVSSLFLTTVAASATLVTATPLMLGIYGVVSKRDPPSNRLWIALGIAAVGIVIIAGGDLIQTSPKALVGDGLALGGAAAIAVYFVLTRRLKAVDVFVMTGISSIVGGTLLVGGAFIFGIDTTVPVHAWIWLLAAAAIPQLIGHSCLFWALRRSTPTEVGIATLSEPVAAGFLAWWILSETPTVLTIIGSAIVLGGVFYSLSSKKESS